MSAILDVSHAQHKASEGPPAASLPDVTANHHRRTDAVDGTLKQTDFARRAVVEPSLVPPPVPAEAVHGTVQPSVRESDSGEHGSNVSGDQHGTFPTPAQTHRTKDTFDSDDTTLPNNTAGDLQEPPAGAEGHRVMQTALRQQQSAEHQQTSLMAASTAQNSQLPHAQNVHAGQVHDPQVPHMGSSMAATNTADGNKKHGLSEKMKPPRPEGTVACPRCNSEETKFCYYNNYNTNQPRYFCKSCQRYWTAGGTLRNVPPGSGKRKNKSSKRCSESQQVSQVSQQTPQQQSQQQSIPMAFQARSDVLSYGLQPGAMFVDPAFAAAASISKAAEANPAAAAALAGPFMPTPGLPHLPMAAAAAAAAASAMQFNPQVAEHLLHMQKGNGPATSAFTMLPTSAHSLGDDSLPPIPAPSNGADGATAASALAPSAACNPGVTSRSTFSGFGLQAQQPWTCVQPAGPEPTSSLLALSGEDGSLGGRRVRLKTDPSLAGNPLPPTSSQQGSDSSPYGNGALSGVPKTSPNAAQQQNAPVQAANEAVKAQSVGQQQLQMDWLSYAAVANQQAAVAQAAQLQAQAAAAYGQSANPYMNGFGWPYGGMYPAAAQQWAAYARYAQQAATMNGAWPDPAAASKPPEPQAGKEQVAMPPPLPQMTSAQQMSKPVGSQPLMAAQTLPWNAWNAMGTALSPWAGWAGPPAVQLGGAQQLPLLQAMGQVNGQATTLDGMTNRSNAGQSDIPS